VSIDLPEANLLSSYYLKKHFPQKKFVGNNQLKKNILTQKNFKKIKYLF
jgi:hypothetical protein